MSTMQGHLKNIVKASLILWANWDLKQKGKSNSIQFLEITIITRGDCRFYVSSKASTNKNFNSKRPLTFASETNLIDGSSWGWILLFMMQVQHPVKFQVWQQAHQLELMKYDGTNTGLEISKVQQCCWVIINFSQFVRRSTATKRSSKNSHVLIHWCTLNCLSIWVMSQLGFGVMSTVSCFSRTTYLEFQKVGWWGTVLSMWLMK